MEQAKKRIKVDVTQDDIDKGKKWASDKCAVARALKRLTKARYVCVRHNIAFVDSMVYLTSKRTAYFIMRFDSGKTVKPTSFIFTQCQRKRQRQRR